MLTDDEPPSPAPAPGFGPALAGMAQLERMGIEELRAHIRALQAEIVLAEAEIGRKEGLRNAADSVFRRP